MTVKAHLIHQLSTIADNTELFAFQFKPKRTYASEFMIIGATVPPGRSGAKIPPASPGKQTRSNFVNIEKIRKRGWSGEARSGTCAYSEVVVSSNVVVVPGQARTAGLPSFFAAPTIEVRDTNP